MSNYTGAVGSTSISADMDMDPCGSAVVRSQSKGRRAVAVADRRSSSRQIVSRGSGDSGCLGLACRSKLMVAREKEGRARVGWATIATASEFPLLLVVVAVSERYHFPNGFCTDCTGPWGRLHGGLQRPTVSRPSRRQEGTD